MTKEERRAFCFGSIVGLLQSFVGMAATVRFGGFAGFLASWGTFLALYKGYKWAFKPAEEPKDEQQ